MLYDNLKTCKRTLMCLCQSTYGLLPLNSINIGFYCKFLSCSAKEHIDLLSCSSKLKFLILILTSCIQALYWDNLKQDNKKNTKKQEI